MKPYIRVFLISLFVSGVIYPLVVTGVSKLFFNKKANGSVIEVDGKKVGSELIGQKFEQEKYFWPRPSAIDYDPMNSGGSNLGPTSRKLQTDVEARKQKEKDFPAEMLFSSGSGLDPDISIENAFYQVPRVAKARNMSVEKIKGLVDIHVKPNPFGTSYVNVLELNVALDKL